MPLTLITAFGILILALNQFSVLSDQQRGRVSLIFPALCNFYQVLRNIGAWQLKCV